MLLLRLWVLEGYLQPPLPSKLDEEEEISLDSAGEGKVVPTSLVWRRVPLQTSSRSPEESARIKGDSSRITKSNTLQHEVSFIVFIPH